MSGKREHGAKKSGADSDLFRYDEWLVAKKIGVKPRHVVRWRREFAVEGIDFERVRGFENGASFERIGLTRIGAENAAQAFGLMLGELSGCELRPVGIQTEVKKIASNVKLLICERVAAREVGTLENVCVRHNGAYRVGDEFLAEREGSYLLKQGGGFLPGEW